MKFIVQMKDPDVLDDAIQDAVNGITFPPEACIDEEELDAIRDHRKEKIKHLCNRWFEYGEHLRVEIDTEAETCTVLPRS